MHFFCPHITVYFFRQLLKKSSHATTYCMKSMHSTQFAACTYILLKTKACRVSSHESMHTGKVCTPGCQLLRLDQQSRALRFALSAPPSFTPSGTFNHTVTHLHAHALAATKTHKCAHATNALCAYAPPSFTPSGTFLEFSTLPHNTPTYNTPHTLFEHSTRISTYSTLAYDSVPTETSFCR